MSITAGDEDLEAFAPLRAGGAYSNLRLAAMNERVRGGISTVPTGQFGTGRSTAGWSQRRNISWRTYDRGKSSRGPDAFSVVGNQPSGGGVYVAAWRSATDASSQERGRCAAPQSFDRQVTQMRQSLQRSGAADAGQSSSSETGGEQSQARIPRARPDRPGVRTSLQRAASINSKARQRARARPNWSGRPTTSDNSGWRRFSDTNSAERNGVVDRPSGHFAGGHVQQYFAAGKFDCAGGFEQQRKTGGASRRDPAETSRLS